MRFLVALVALTYPTLAPAQPVIVQTAVIRPQRVLPPLEYDRDFKGTMIVRTKETQQEVREICPKTVFAALGCAFRLAPDYCVIILASDAAITAAGYTTEIVKRHEVGHCNGWPADHRGAREIPR